MATAARLGLLRLGASPLALAADDNDAAQDVAGVDTTLPLEIPQNCCESPGGNAGTTTPVDNTVILPAWIPSCAFGGTVPSAADITNSEDWDELDGISTTTFDSPGANDDTRMGLTEVASIVTAGAVDKLPQEATTIGLTEVATLEMTGALDTTTTETMRLAMTEVADLVMTGAVDVPAQDAAIRVAMTEVATIVTTGAVDILAQDTSTTVATTEATALIATTTVDESASRVVLNEIADLEISGAADITSADATTRVAVTEVPQLVVMIAVDEAMAVAESEGASAETVGDTQAITTSESLPVGISEVSSATVRLDATDTMRVRVSENEMAQLNLQGGSIYPTAPAFANATVAFVNSTLNDGVDRVAVVFRAPKTGTLHSFQWRQGTNATAPGNGVRYAFQDTDGAGDPDGTDDQFRDITTGFGAATWLVPPGPITSDGTDSGTKRTVTAGEVVAAVIYLPSFTTGSVTFSQIDLAGGANTGLAGLTYMDIKAAAWAPNFNSPTMVLRYDDGTYMTVGPDAHPILNLNTTTFNSGSTPDERGLRFTVPMRTYVSGAWVRLDLDAACDIVLYDSDGTTVLASTSLVSTARSATSAQTCVVPFAPVSLLADTVYRLVVKPTTVSNVSTYDYDATSATVLAAAPGGATWWYTSRTNAGAWDDTATTKRPWIGLLIAGLTT